MKQGLGHGLRGSTRMGIKTFSMGRFERSEKRFATARLIDPRS
jgi:hypothetical protein